MAATYDRWIRRSLDDTRRTTTRAEPEAGAHTDMRYRRRLAGSWALGIISATCTWIGCSILTLTLGWATRQSASSDRRLWRPPLEYMRRACVPAVSQHLPHDLATRYSGGSAETSFGAFGLPEPVGPWRRRSSGISEPTVWAGLPFGLLSVLQSKRPVIIITVKPKVLLVLRHRP